MNFTTVIRNHRDAAQLAERLLNADTTRPLMVQVSFARKRRSVSQNALYWLWLTEIRDWLWSAGIGYENERPYTTDELHEWHKALFLGERVVEIEGKAVRARRSSAALNVQQMIDYLQQIEAHWVQQGCPLTQPEGTYQDAFGRQVA